MPAQRPHVLPRRDGPALNWRRNDRSNVVRTRVTHAAAVWLAPRRVAMAESQSLSPASSSVPLRASAGRFHAVAVPGAVAGERAVVLSRPAAMTTVSRRRHGPSASHRKGSPGNILGNFCGIIAANAERADAAGTVNRKCRYWRYQTRNGLTTVTRASDETPTQIAAAKPSRICMGRSRQKPRIADCCEAYSATGRKVCGANGQLANDFPVETEMTHRDRKSTRGTIVMIGARTLPRIAFVQCAIGCCPGSPREARGSAGPTDRRQGSFRR